MCPLAITIFERAVIRRCLIARHGPHRRNQEDDCKQRCHPRHEGVALKTQNPTEALAVLLEGKALLLFALHYSGKHYCTKGKPREIEKLKG